MADEERVAIRDVASHLLLKSEQTVNVGNSESLRLALQHLCDAYSIDRGEIASRTQAGRSFPGIYHAGLRSLEAASTGGDYSSRQTPDHSISGAAFQKFLARLKASTKFFEGAPEGTVEYDERVRRAHSKFKARLAERREHTRPDTGNGRMEEHAPDDERKQEARHSEGDVGADNEERAEIIKEEGNVMLKANNYEGALRKYSEAITLNGKKAAYYSNRAAALIHLGRLSEAVSDCERALAIDSSFLRARERLALAYRKLGMFDLEHEALVTAGQLHPNEPRLEREIAGAAERNRLGRDDALDLHVRGSGATPSVPGTRAGPGGTGAGPGNGDLPPGFPGMPDLSALMGANGGDMSGLMSMANALAANPAVANMMQESASSGGNPQDMFARMVQNPELMQTMMQSFGSVFAAGNQGTGNAGAPDSDTGR
jgi:small glutamine-rich tetratricopeptide repeat-containing protein alpha